MKRFALTFGAGLLALGACAASAQNLRIGLQEDPDVLDPHRARTYVGRIVFTSLCDKLIDIDPKLHFVPQLATSWSFSEDNKTLTFKLREDALFHDGSKFDAAAAKANLDRAMSLPDSLRRGELGSVAKVEAPDAATLVLTLKQPDATLLAQLSDRAGMMLSPKTFGDDVAAVGRKPVCSGPYKFVERIQNDRIVLDKFDQYYDAKDYAFKRLTFLPIPDTTVRLSNLRAGDLDLLERLNPSDVPQVKTDASLTFAPVAGLASSSSCSTWPTASAPRTIRSRTSWCARPSSTRLTATPSTKWPAAASSSRRSSRSRPPVPITATSSRRPSATWPRPARCSSRRASSA